MTGNPMEAMEKARVRTAEVKAERISAAKMRRLRVKAEAGAEGRVMAAVDMAGSSRQGIGSRE
jgi:hypothetical protein